MRPLARTPFALLGLLALTFAGARTAGAVTVVEPGHTLRLIADSAAPLDPSQAGLGLFPSVGIESITYDEAEDLLYVQLTDGAFACTSISTSLFAIDPGTGVTTLINPATGLGICDRGSDIDVDPATGLIVAQDGNFPGSRLASVDPVTGTVDTWAAPAVFMFNTFGMGFSNGAGAVPAGDVIYVADLGGGINVATFGGMSIPLASPPSGGDDLYIQPDGDVIWVGDDIAGLLIYDPVTFTFVPSGVPSVLDMFAMAGLPFNCGTRSAVCEASGEAYITTSCAPGGSAVFRVNEALDLHELILTMGPDEGIHDVTTGPASVGSGISLYFTVQNMATGGQQVWELTDACPLTAVEAQMDIKPGSCPNAFQRGQQGVLPVGLIGAADFDAEEVDVSSLQLSRADGVGGSVAPLMGPPGPHPVIADVATPFPGDLCDCHTLTGDGIRDVSMKFSVPELVQELELLALPSGDAIELTLTGTLLDGTAFFASDCLHLTPNLVRLPPRGLEPDRRPDLPRPGRR